MPEIHKIGWKTATSIVISSMIGTGVFTSLGFQLVEVQNTWSIVLLWFLGGALALIGAFTFAELGTHYKRTGGDYIFISEAISPFLGYLSAWTSMIVGFSAPVAIAAIAMESYLMPFKIPNIRVFSVTAVILICLFHSFSLRQSSAFQNFSTVFKIAFVFFVLGLGVYFLPIPNNAISFSTSLSSEVFKPGFAVSLLYVTYAYTGWNTSAYIVEEIDKPEKNLPKSLIIGTLSVTIVYILLQFVFLKFSTFTQLKGQVDVALIATNNILGTTANKWISAGIAFQLIATMSSYIWVGPRIIHSMAQQYKFWKWLRPTNAHNIPIRALWFQCFLILLLLFSGSLERIMLYTSFLLQLMGTLAVSSIFFTKRQTNDYHSPFRPYLQYLYVGFSLFVLTFIVIDRPTESLIGLGILGVGATTYFLSKSA